MAGSKAIKAGEAYWEVTIRDKIKQGLSSASAKLKAFGSSVQALQAGVGLSAIGGGFLATINNVAGKFLEVSKFAKDAGKSIAGIDSSKADRLSESVSTLEAAFGAIKFLIGEALAGPLADISDLFIQAAVAVAQFVSDNEFLVQVIAGVGAGMAVAGAGILAASASMATLGTLIEVVTGAMVGLQAVMAASMAFLATPAGAVLVIVGAITAAVVLALMNWNKFVRGVIESVAFMAEAMAAFSASLERDFGGNFGSAGLQKWADEFRKNAALFPDEKSPAAGAASGARRPDFAKIAGPPTEFLSGSAGTFNGSRAAMALGIGSGGGIEKKLDESNEKQERIVRVLEEIKRKPSGSTALTFQ